jgi:hypothetical protein
MPVVSVLRVNNNELSDYTQFLPTLSLMLWQPTLHLHWLDLSYNKLTTIDQVPWTSLCLPSSLGCVLTWLLLFCVTACGSACVLVRLRVDRRRVWWS